MSINLKSHPDKSLKNHLLNVGKSSEKLINLKELNLTIISKNDLLNLSYLIGISHDFGKATSYFQDKMNNVRNSPFSHHGLISALFGYLLLNNYFNNREFSMIAYIVIKKHHGNLESPLEDIKTSKDLKKQIEDLNNKERYNELEDIYTELFKEKRYNLDFNKIFQELISLINDRIYDFVEDEFEDLIFKNCDNKYFIERFLITNFLYSILIECDKVDAANINIGYFENNLNVKVSVEKYLNKKKIENPNDYDENKELNKIRNEFYYEVINNVNIKKENFIYKLTAPTGIGKTFVSFEFANKLKNLFSEGKRIIYCLPYTSIIDQNHSIIEEILSFNIGEEFTRKQTKYLLKHHHLTPFKLLEDIETTKDSDDYLTFFDKKLLLESWKSANIVTTFVQLFQSIISNKNSFLLKFHNIVNSIIILDEIQTLPVQYYKLIGEIFTVLSERFNTYILFLTATQPKIILENDKYINLIDEYKYAKHKEFDRVDLVIFNNLKPLPISDFILKFKNEFIYNSGLVICNKIGMAIKIYKELQNIFEKKEYRVYSLTTNIIPIERKRIIDEIKEKLKNKEKILVISTQLVEAGVDLSFEVVYRDLAPIDSIVQAAGRSNRNNELKEKNKKGKLFLYNLIEENEIEGNSIYDIKLIKDTKDYLKNDFYKSSDFINLSMQYFSNITKERESNKVLNSIKKLNYNIEKKRDEIPIKDFKIINDDFYKTDIIVSFNSEIDKKIQRLIELHNFIKFNTKYEFEKEFEELENLKKDLNNYMVSVNKQTESKISIYLEEFNNIKFINFCYLDKVYDKNIGFILDLKDPSSICL